MFTLRAKIMNAWRRGRNALRRLWRQQLPPREPVASAWSAGVYREPGPRRLFGRRAQRTLNYRLYLPRDRAPQDQLPLLVMLHGCSQDAEQFAAGTRMNAVAQEHNCAVLYPEQSSAANALRCWNWFDREVQRGEGEAGVIVRLVQELMRSVAIDPRRIYVAGMSAGAAMAEILALRNPEFFAACALHSGVAFAAAGSAGEALRVMRSGATAAPAECARRLTDSADGKLLLGPALVVHGSTDARVEPRNAEQIVAVRLVLAGMAVSLGQEPEPGKIREFEAGGRKVRQRDYTAGSRLLVRSLLIEGLGHAWSGGDPQLPFNDAAGPDASALILNFLLETRLPLRATDAITSMSVPEH
jgi:poly(hydroxyalkanoate) depolymerase family esterase